MGRLQQLGEHFVLEGHEVQVLELENLVLVGVGVSLRRQRYVAHACDRAETEARGCGTHLNEVSELVLRVADGVGAETCRAEH